MGRALNPSVRGMPTKGVLHRVPGVSITRVPTDIDDSGPCRQTASCRTRSTSRCTMTQRPLPWPLSWPYYLHLARMSAELTTSPLDIPVKGKE